MFVGPLPSDAILVLTRRKGQALGQVRGVGGLPNTASVPELATQNVSWQFGDFVGSIFNHGSLAERCKR